MRVRITVAVGLVAVVLAAALVPPARAHQPGVLLATFQDPLLDESSGVAVGSAPPGVFFTHEDSGGGSVFMAIGPAGETLATYQLPFGVHRSIDWEDMAAAGGSLFLGDIGDNHRVRPFVTVYEVAQPAVAGDPTTSTADLRRVHHLVYPDGPHDAEALVVDPVPGRLAVVTKEASGRSGVYLAGAPAATVAVGLDATDLPVTVAPQVVSVLHRVATIDLDAIASAYDPTLHLSPLSRLLVTGADVSPDGTRLVVRTYVEAFELDLGPAGLAGLAGGQLGDAHRIDLPVTGQGEAIGYAHDGASLLITSEGLHAPIHLVPAG